MSLPVVTQILNEIGLRLTSITLENEYQLPPKKIERARLEPLKNGDLPAIVYYSGEDNLVEHGHGFDKRELAVIVESYTITRDKNFDDTAQLLETDVAIAVNRAVAFPKVSDNPSISLGKLVQQVHVASSAPVLGQNNTNPFCGVLISLSVIYKVQKLDPYTLIN